jgi:ornithine cyclodeaminase/alanine dehydrogenase-like protein (mu-crystallin family)
MVGADELRAALRFEDLIEPSLQAFQESSAGYIQNGLIVLFPGATQAHGDVYIKTGAARGHSVFVVKVSPWFRINAELGRAQSGFIAAFDSQTGDTLAILTDEHYLSDIRTAAAGAIAARALVPPVIKVAGVLGAGVQAYLQPQALHRERPFDELLIWARKPEQARSLRNRLATALPEVEIRIVGDLEKVVHGADVLITATAAREPLVRGKWLHDGQHITALGADDPTKCELDAGALQRARVFVDSVATTAANGDVYRAIDSGDYTLDQISAELGEVLDGSKPGRIASTDITIATLVGIGAQDLIAVEVALEKLGCLPLNATALTAPSPAAS